MRLGEDISITLTMDGKEFAVQVKNANAMLRELRQSLHQTAESTHRIERNFNGLGTAFRHFMIMASTARFALLDFHDVFLRLPLSVIKSSAEIERMTKLMEGLSTATDKVADAKNSRNFVFEMAKTAPFDVQTLTDSFVKLKSGGIDPTNGSMKALVDSVARFGGSSQQLHRASIAIQQMAGKGVVSMEELRQQLGEAVPTAINMMAVGVGKSMAELVQSISKGEVEAKSALARMFAVMGFENEGAAAKMMTTWTGMFEQLKTKWELFKYELAGGDSGVGAFAEAKKTLQELLDSFNGSQLRSFGQDLSSAVSFFATALKETTQFVVKFYDEIKIAGQVVLAAFASAKILASVTALQASFRALSATYAASATDFVAASRAKQIAKAGEHMQMVSMMQAERASVVAQIAQSQTLFALGGQQTAMWRANQAALQGRLATIEANIVAERALATQLVATGAAATSAGALMRGLGAVFTALGGPIMVLTGIIMGAVYVWDKYANAAERAAKRAKDAWAGVADTEALAETDKELAERREKLAKAQVQIGKGFNLGQNQVTVEREIAEIARLEKLRSQQEYNVKKAAKDDRIQQETTLNERANAESSDALRRAYEVDKKNREALLSERLAAAKGDKKKEKAAREEFDKLNSEATRNFAVAGTNAKLYNLDTQAQTLRDEIAAAEKKGEQGKAEADNARASLVALMDKRNALMNELEQRRLIGTPNETVSKKDEGGGVVRKLVGSLDKHLADAQADLDIAEGKQKAMLGDLTRMQSIDAEVRTKFDAMLKSGELTKVVTDKKGKQKAVGIDPANNKADRDGLEELIRREVRAKQLAAAQSALTSQTNALNEEQAEFDILLKSQGESAEFINGPLRNLTAQYEKQMALLTGLGEEETKGITNAYNKRALMAAETAAIRYQLTATEQAEQAKIDLTINSQDKIRLEYDRTTRKLALEFEQRKADLLKSADFEKLTEEEKQKKLLGIVEAYEKLKEAAAARFNQESMTGVERLMQSWMNVTQQMDQATTSWVQSFSDNFTEMITTGKANWKSFATMILKDIARIAMQKAIAGIVGNIIGGMAGAGASAGPDTSALTNMDAGAMTSAADSAAIAADLAGTAYMLNGGIMSKYGELPLRTYSKGGVATTPQMAIYAEGSMNEAFVPLPDGRSIPVTMDMPPAGNSVSQQVNISIVVNEGEGEDKKSSGDDTGAWKKMADRIKAVVKDELVTQQRPGGILYK